MLELFISVLLIYLIYYISNIRKFDKYGNARVKKEEIKSKNEIIENNYKTLPVEVKYFVKKYNVKLNMINNNGLLRVVGLILGIDITIVTVIVAIIFKDRVLIQVFVASLLLIPIYLLSIRILASQFKKKGLIKNEGNKEPKGNRK